MPERRPRITRHRRGRRFVYRVGHRQVRRREELLRIARLAIPPAWSDVEISRSPSAKVLARGRDAEGRTQRIYNPAFRRRQERRKFEQLPRFGEALPALRAQVERDLSRRHRGRKRVTAGAVRLIDGEHPAVLDEVRRARARMRDRRHFPVDEQATQALLAAMEHPRG